VKKFLAKSRNCSVLNPGQYGSPGNFSFAFKIERMVLVKKLIALSLVACMLAITAIGCGGSTTGSGTKGGSGGSTDTGKKADK
jgi:hypothetical protein